MKTFSCRLSLFVGLLWAGTLTAYDFEYDAGDIEEEKDSTGITYTLSVSKGDLGTSYDFDTKEGVTSGSPTGIDINVSSGGATGTKAYPNDSLPTANFTISMNGKLIPPSGGSGTQPTWGASGNAKAPFHIKSDQNGGEKDIVVPHGTSVKYSAYQGTSLQNSTWSVTGFPSKEAEEIRFNKSFWLSLWPWSAPNIINPEPGVYNISATSKDPAGGSDSAQMTVVGGEFKEHSSHAYGFDDYTNWNKNATDYYGAKTGKCTLPYASVRSGYQGRSNFVLTPTSISKDVEFLSSTNRLLFVPATIKSTTEVIFNASSGWLSSSATLSAKLNNTAFAQLGVSSFDQTSKQMLIVLVVPNESITVTAPSGTSSANLNKVYQQVVLKINCSTATFIYSAAPRKWTSSDRVSLKNAFIVSPPPGIAISDYDHILFVVTGSDSGNALAWGELGGKYMWIYTSTNYKYVVAHELGHNYGLDDQYTSNSGNVTMGDDKYNLMNAVNSSIQSEQFRLRKSQWTTIK